eukprot:CAMPEP_0170536924 /NCGR_PEP_ID=MMETSP0209-20121228/102421_1 /TAXON_ID=665100 ORGANISM="Litonotus pictus, Strain P1" /NCGR_SAMPLE_ID=MMETSP0209 /ASSEMBLY_ACC=CAM_ASM_000301 /LENGTH=1124 /DNA_ID=CAMNT_0010838347 /DNA_START=2178 /DNA_END=5552 /DNA_ORIENTATION=-
MLPSRGENIQYASFIRETTLDYDFVITNDQGKIEMVSKSIAKSVRLNTTLINSIDYYYIHFICKEYLSEINLLTHPDYTISELNSKHVFSSGKDERKNFKYNLLHLKPDPFIDQTLKEFKKNESNTNSTNNKNSPLIKIISHTKQIKDNYKFEKSIIMYSIIENISPCQNETLKLFKLFNSINHDQTVNMDEIQVIEKYIKNDKYFNYTKAKRNGFKENSGTEEEGNDNSQSDSDSEEEDDYNNIFEKTESSNENSSINTDLRKRTKLMQQGLNSSKSGEDSNSKNEENLVFNSNSSEEGRERKETKKYNKYSNTNNPYTGKYKVEQESKSKLNNNYEYEFITNQPLSTEGNSKLSNKYRKMKEYDFNLNAFVKPEEEEDHLNKDFQEITEQTASSQTSLSSRTEAEFFKQYLSIKKRYENKKIYQEFRLIIVIDLIILIGIIVLICFNYLVNFQKILDTLGSINREFFPMINIIRDLSCIQKNIETVLNDNSGLVDLSVFNANKELQEYKGLNLIPYEEYNSYREGIYTSSLNRYEKVKIFQIDYSNVNDTSQYESKIFNASFLNDPYKEISYNYLSMCFENYHKSLKVFFSSNLTFASEMKDFLFEEFEISKAGGNTVKTSIFNSLQILYLHMGLLNDLSLIKIDNPNIYMIKKNLEKGFIDKINQIFISSLEFTKDSIDNYIYLKFLFFIFTIILILFIAILIYSSILIYYRKQYELISLLLGIEEDTSSTVLESVKYLSNFLRQKNSLERINSHNSINHNNDKFENQEEDRNEEEALIEDNNNDYERGNQKKTTKKENKKNDKKNSGQFGSFNGNRIQGLGYFSGGYNGKNEINWKIYLDVLVKIFFIIGLTLVPFIILVSSTSLENKSTKFIDLIKNTKENEFYMISSFLNFQSLVKEKNQTLIDEKHTKLKSLLHDFRQNQFNTSSLLYDTVSDLSNSEEFKQYFSIQICPDQEIVEGNISNPNPYYKYIYDCQRKDSPYKGEGYSYTSNINNNLIDDLLRNSIIMSNSKTTTDIRSVYENPNFVLSEKTFDLLVTYGIDTFNSYMKGSIDAYVSTYDDQYFTLLIFSFLLLLFNQVSSIMFVRHIIRVVNYELKNIFSLMPYIIVMGNANIYEMLRK